MPKVSIIVPVYNEVVRKPLIFQMISILYNMLVKKEEKKR